MSLTNRYAGPFSRREAILRARAVYRRICRRRGIEYPTPPSGHHGSVRVGDPSISYARAELPIRKGRRPGEWFVRLTVRAENLPEGSEEIDGEATPITRTGTTRPDRDFADSEDI